MPGIPSDLHAANVIDHLDCKARFMISKAIEIAAREAIASLIIRPMGNALISVIKHLAANRANIYNSISVWNM